MWDMPVNPLGEYTITTSGVWNSSPDSKFQVKSNGFIPIWVLVLLYISTSTFAKKFPL